MLLKHGNDSERPLCYSHIDIAGAAGKFKDNLNFTDFIFEKIATFFRSLFGRWRASNCGTPAGVCVQLYCAKTMIDQKFNIRVYILEQVFSI